MELNITNGKVHDADQDCAECDTAALPANFAYCPFCGHELP